VVAANPRSVASADADVPLERPRDLAELRGKLAYGEMWERLWKLLDSSTIKEES
jgi:NitT/TauT family transport system ATP-binding protein